MKADQRPNVCLSCHNGVVRRGKAPYAVAVAAAGSIGGVALIAALLLGLKLRQMQKTKRIAKRF